MENLKIYHLCVRCRRGLMFRSRQDYIRFINTLALLALKYKVRVLAYAVMSNHYHLAVMADDIGKFFRMLGVSYANYYYCKYGVSLPKVSRKVLEVAGNLHIVTLLAYIIRNPVHHGLVGNPFVYPYSSAVCYFAYPGSLYSIGSAPVIKREKTPLPKCYGGDREGMIDPMSIVDYRMVETLFVTSGRFMYFTTRYSGPKWEKEQMEENASVSPVTLKSVEGDEADLDSWLKYEKGHGRLLVPDQLLCELVDTEHVPRYGSASFAQLTWEQSMEVVSMLRSEWKIAQEQAERCVYHV